MSRKAARFSKRYGGWMCVNIFCACIFYLLASALPAHSALPAFEKSYPYGYENRLDPNVLILIDTSGSMASSAVDMSKTLGDGTKPFLNQDHPEKGYQNYFGKDIYAGNNDPKGMYYHPELKYITVGDFLNIFPNINSLPGENGYSDDPTTWIEEALSFYYVSFLNIWDISGYLKVLGGKHENDLSDPDYLANVTTYSPTSPLRYTRYKHPNDSRLYQVRAVLNNLFTNPEIMNGLRINLATFIHEPAWTNGVSGFGFGYAAPYVSMFWINWMNQYITQNPSRSTGDYNKSDPRMRYLSSSFDYLWRNDGSGKIVGNEVFSEKLSRWFDGVEGKDNPEIRAFGATPLWHSFSDLPEVYDPNKPDCEIQNWCQQNWIILLTDGDDQRIIDKKKMGTLISNLYKNTPHFKGISSPCIMNTKLIVIAFIDGEEAPNAMKDSCKYMADAGNDGMWGSDEGNEKMDPYYASDIHGLMDAFYDAFRKIKDFSSSGGSPLVTSEQADENNTKVYQASFFPKRDNMWEGHFKKYVVTNTSDDKGKEALSTVEEWDASSMLAEMEGVNRRIYTVTAGDLAVDGSPVYPMVPFSYNLTLANNMGCSEEEARQLIEDLRGSLGNGKLGDIYHSGFVKIGLPASEEISEDIDGYRDTIIYVQANDGMLHAFNDESTNENPAGAERWAFIPPNVLSLERLRGLKLDSAGKWLSGHNMSSRYLCDGPLVAEDVEDGLGNWKTVLLACLGYGGAGMYALDVTDPDNPQFMWALENDIFDEGGNIRSSSSNRVVRRWTSEKFRIARHSDIGANKLRRYRDTLFTMSTPFIGRITSSAAESYSSLRDRWVAIMGNGSTIGSSSPWEKGSVLIMDILNGDVLKRLNLPDKGQVVSPIVVPMPTSGGELLVIEQFYLASDKGRIYRADLVSDKIEEVGATVPPRPSNGISYSMDLARVNDSVWLFMATGDFDPLLKQEEGVENNYVCAVNTDGNINGDLTELLPGEMGTTSTSSNGWMLKLDAEDSVFEMEYVTGMPYYYKGYVFFSTFKKGKDTCSLGDSRLYCMKAGSGSGGWGGEGTDKYVTIHNVRITGLTISNNLMYIGATTYVQENNLEELPPEFQWAGEGFNLIIGPAAHTTETGTLDSNSILKPLYWRHRNFKIPES